MHALEVIKNQNDLIDQANVYNKSLRKLGYQLAGELPSINPHLYNHYSNQLLRLKRAFRREALARRHLSRSRAILVVLKNGW